jgi:Concanavalin A-like lectin/glucanases superfamily/Secretion system C-terminal sorting domain
MKKTFTLFALMIFSQFVFGQINLNQGVIAHYPFTGNANDSSGNNNNGVVFGATLTAGLSGIPNTAYRFNGTSNYIEIPNSATLTPTLISMCAVIKVEGFYAGLCQGNVIMWKGSNFDVGHYGLHMSDALYNIDCNTIDSLNETFYPEISSNGTGFAYTPVITSNTWYCIVATYDGDSSRLYVDGNLMYAVSTPAPIGVSTDPIDFGHNIYNPQYPYWFNGIMDDIRIYDRVLNPAEVNAYCNIVSGIVEASEFPLFELNNLSQGIFNLTFKDNYKDIHISVYNYLGQKVNDNDFTAAVNGTIHQINLSGCVNGVYLLELNVDGKQLTRKLVKQ